MRQHRPSPLGHPVCFRSKHGKTFLDCRFSQKTGHKQHALAAYAADDDLLVFGFTHIFTSNCVSSSKLMGSYHPVSRSENPIASIQNRASSIYFFSTIAPLGHTFRHTPQSVHRMRSM